MENIVIGRVVGVFGLKGFLKVWPLTDFPERFDEGRTIFIAETPRKILESQWHKKQVRIRVEGIKKIAEAEALINSVITAPADERPALEAQEYLVSDLIGLEVYDESGKVLGKLVEVISAPAQDLYRVGEAYIPAVSEFVREIDLENKRMVIRPIPGLFENAD